MGLKPIYSSHSGENISNIVFELAKELQFEENLRWFVLDNATNNDTAIENIEKFVLTLIELDSTLKNDDFVVLVI